MFNALCFYKNFLHWLGLTLLPVATLPEPNGHRGISFSSGYFIGVLLAMISSHKRRILQIVILIAIFISLSFFLVAGKEEFNTSLFTRALALVALGVTTFFITLNLTRETKNKKRKLEGIFAYSTQGIILIDRTGTIELANPFLEKMFGYKNDALLVVKGDEGKPEASRILNEFYEHLDEACVGTVSEIFDADLPYMPRGAAAQGWGVAEVLRVSVGIAKGRKPRVRSKKSE